MGKPLTKVQLEQELRRALDEYYKKEQVDGADVAQAGQWLAGRIDEVLSGPICGPSREERLRDKGMLREHQKGNTNYP